MKNKKLFYFLGGLFLCIGVLTLLVFNVNSPSVEQIEDTLTLQQRKDAALTETLTTGTYTFSTPYVELNPYGNSPLSALIAFDLDTEQSVTVTVVGRDEHSTFQHTFEAATSHLIPVYGLYADTLNSVKLTLEDGNETTINIQTAPLPDDLAIPSVTTVKKDQLQNELYFFTPATAGYTAAYDINGDVRWYLTTKNIWDIKRLDNGNLLLSSDRTIAPPYYMTGLVEMDLLGKIYVEYTLEEGYHHDAVELPSGNFLVAANHPDRSTVEDYVVEVDRMTGEVIKTWDLMNVLPTDAAKSENWTEHDWFHNNSVDFDEAHQAIILSGRHQDAVISIDYETGALNWIVGDKTGWPEEMQSYFFTPTGDDFEWQWSQHSAKIFSTGELAIFDNGNNRSKDAKQYISAEDNYSRGVLYELNTDDMTISQTFEFGKSRGSSFYSPYISEIDELGAHHYLIHSGGIGSINGIAVNQPAYFYDHADLVTQTVELLNDEVIFELEFNSHFYRASKMSLYPETSNYSLTPGVRLGTLGETKTLPIKVTGLRNNKNDLPEQYHVSLLQESDRLILNGDFYSSQKVKLILNRLGEQRVYDVRITSTPYTAMCVDLFNHEAKNPDQLNITKYINATGLHGKYELYLEIDGIIYPLSQSVSF